MKKDLIYASGAIVIGSIISYYIDLGRPVIIGLLAVSLCLFLFSEKRGTFILLSLSLGIFLMARQEKLASIGDLGHLSALARIEEVTGQNENYNTYRAKVLELNSRPYKENVILSYKNPQSFEPGDIICLTGTSQEIRPKTNPEEFDYSIYQKIRGVRTQLKVESAEKLAEEKSPIFKAKTFFHSYIEKSLSQGLDEKNKDFMLKSLTAKSNLSQEEKESFSKLGLAHILAISGFHISIISALIFFIMDKLAVHRYIGIFLSIGILSVYLYFIDFPASALRAIIMQSVLGLSIILKRGFDKTKALALAIFLMVLVNPYRVFDMGMVLSVFSILGLIYKDRIFGYRKSTTIVEIIKVSFAVNIFLFPFLLKTFNSFNFINFLPNLLILPIFSIAMLGAIAMLIAGLFSTKLSYILGIFVNKALDIIMSLVGLFDQVDFLNIRFKSMGLGFFLFYYFFLFAYINRWELRRISLGFKEGVFKALSIGLASLMAYIAVLDPIYVSFIDVGQGDAIYIESLNNSLMLDTGGSSFSDASYKYTVKSFLNKHTSRPVELLISHNDMDHAANLKYMLEDGLVSGVYHSKYEDELVFKEVAEGDVFKIGPARLRIVFDGEGAASSNDKSLVGLLSHHNTSLLLTGDTEQHGENELIKRNIQADILKVAHHGSNHSTSSEFLDQLRPKDAIISVGRSNPYGHPSKELLQRLENRDIEIYRTDLDGQVRLEINRFNYKIDSYIKEKPGVLGLVLALALVILTSKIYYSYFKSLFLSEERKP